MYRIFLFVALPLLLLATAAPTMAYARRPTAGSLPLAIDAQLQIWPAQPAVGQVIEAIFTIRNAGGYPITLSNVGAGGRGPDCGDWSCPNVADYPLLSSVTLAPGQQLAYREQRVFWEAGDYFSQILYQASDGRWHFIGGTTTYQVGEGVIIDNFTISPTNPDTDDLIVGSFTLHNATTAPLTYARAGIGARGPHCTDADWGCPQIADLGFFDNLTLGAGETRELSFLHTLRESGDYFAQVWLLDAQNGWHPAGELQRFTVQPAAQTPREDSWRFGVHFHPNYDGRDGERLRLAAAVGVDVIRISVDWRLLEPNYKGDWANDWYIPMLESVLAAAAALDLDVILLLQHTPCWASTDPAKQCTLLRQRAPLAWSKSYPPYSFDDYADAFVKLIDLFGHQIDIWEVWNEPNIPRFWQPQPDAAAYARMLQTAYRAIKQRQPHATVLGGSIAGADSDYLHALYAAGVAGHFDALALHPYSAGAPDDCTVPRSSYRCGVESIRNVMLYHNDDKPIWFTEFGWSSYDGVGGYGVDLQRDYLADALNWLQYWDYVPVAMWYNLVDTTIIYPDMPHEQHFGLFDSNMQAKPAATWLILRRAPAATYLPLLSVDRRAGNP